MSKESEAVARIMKGLKCSEAEAKEIYATDCAIDRGEPQPFDLSPAQEKIARKYAHTGTRKTPTAYKFTKRERKPNATKEGIVAEIAQFLTENSNFDTKNVEITNKNREITFTVGEETFTWTLVQKRKPKN